MRTYQVLNIGIKPMSSDEEESLYGYLYNWHAASNANFAPTGWHVPTATEWNTLSTFLGTNYGGGMLKSIGTSQWTTPNTNATNQVRFKAFPAGSKYGSAAINLYEDAAWWTSTTQDSSNAQYRYVTFDASTIGSTYTTKSTYFSVRLLKDNSTNPVTVTDYVGNVYNCISINGQVWTAENWRCPNLNDGTAIPIVENVSASPARVSPW